jgi:hypothetical protein
MELRKRKTAESEDIEAGVNMFIRHMRHGGLHPFAGCDSSAGMEFELQVAVEGDHKHVDLPLSISQSGFFRNIIKRSARGDLPPGVITSLKEFLFHNDGGIWENSWVRLQEDRLGETAKRLLHHDLLADKGQPDGPKRSDCQRFFFTAKNETWLRLPISYLLKLALADAVDSSAPITVLKTGRDLLSHFLSDNTSPEILSFTISQAQSGAIGRSAARETARTFLISQVLVQYANTKLGLLESGQKCLLYNAPHAPNRQKKLNEIVPDGFYRHLFMSPCLSGWDRGEEKHRYMEVCHRTLSRSQLNTISKLKDAGIITNNLVVLPNTSNTCLANNGTHVSLGSSLLTSLAASGRAEFSPAVEKHIGDLVVKVVEHFLPLFVNTYTAAPYRVDFADFHPEKVLGFLPHELDYTHLRMLWRRWKKKADLRFFGHPFTPFGPRRIDQLFARCLGLHGDLVPDFRLTDYLVSILSTETCPALDGRVGNQIRLKEELAELGVFDRRMSMYLLYRQREYGSMGFAGFEGRSYSLFHSLLDDMAGAVDMQNLITALAYRFIIEEKVRHQDIPDRPSVESERRQIFFACAIGIPTFFVKADTPNRFLRKILSHVKNQRNSRRYKGYIRVRVLEYQLALLEVIGTEGRSLVESMGLSGVIEDLRFRLTEGGARTLDKLIMGAMQEGKCRKRPLTIPADAFNGMTEHYYRTELKRLHTREGLRVLAEDCEHLEKLDDPSLRQVMAARNRSAAEFIRETAETFLNEAASPEDLQHLLQIGLAVIHNEIRKNR